MSKKALIVSILAVFISFLGGFFFSNAFNRQEISNLQAEVGRLKNASPAPDEDNSQTALTTEEIRQKIGEADSNPGNIEFQKNLGVALYRYASMKQDAELLPDAARLLERVHERNPNDYNTILTLAGLYADFSQIKNDGDAARKSRELYQKALAIKPNDADARTDLGASFLSGSPPEYEKAIAEFQKSLQINPKDERTLEFITRALANAGKNREAEIYAGKLREINPKNEALPDLETLLAQGKNK